MNSPDPLHRLLESMSEPPPPDSLWPRLRERRRRQVRRRRLAGGLASTALVAVLLVAGWPQQPAAPGTSGAASTVTRIDRGEQVRALDHALQAAYDRGASDQEVAPLWDARAALLAGLDTPRGSAADVNDI